ncbi:MAG: NAD-dependent epimerase/dehydratase family protein [Dehalococcoidia bacterium]
MDLAGKRVLVSGGAGFIGSNTAWALLEAGADVVVVDNLWTGLRSNVPEGARFIESSVANRDLPALLGEWRPDILYHFAFNVLVPKAVEDPRLDLESIEGSINLLEMARRQGIEKIVFASSGFLYGNTDQLPVAETAPIIPVSPYVVSKRAVEDYLEFYRSAYGISYAITRYAAVYGPGQVTGAMADYIRKLRAGAQADIWGDGLKTRDYVFIDDVVRANLLMLDAPDEPDGRPIYNVGTGIETTLNELYARIARLLDRQPSPIYHPDRPGEQMRYALDATRLRERLGWEPQVSLDEGLARIIATLPD